MFDRVLNTFLNTFSILNMFDLSHVFFLDADFLFSHNIFGQVIFSWLLKYQVILLNT